MNTNVYGGAGAYIKGVLQVTAGEVLKLVVGRGGMHGTTDPSSPYGGGGGNAGGGGTGGGRSAIIQSIVLGSSAQYVEVVSVGAGGGAGADAGSTGGCGGRVDGISGVAEDIDSTVGTCMGNGASQSTGGTHASGCTKPGGDGSQFSGGLGLNMLVGVVQGTTEAAGVAGHHQQAAGVRDLRTDIKYMDV